MVYFIIIGVLLLCIIVVLIRFQKANKELKTLKKEAEQRFDMQQSFISSLSQELRTPLYGIMGLTNLLVEEYPDLKEDKNLKSLKFSGNYLLTLISNVLHVNFLESDDVVVQNNTFDLKEMSQNVLNSFSYATENSGNVLHFDFDPEIDETVNGDSSILSQILINLISNALRFSQNGNVYFSVNLIRKFEKTSKISFKIKHDGSEVSPEEYQSIYREFINIEKAQKSYLNTAGINSKIVKRLTKAIQGEIIIQNKNRVGSEYVLVTELNIPEVKKSSDQNHPLSMAPKSSFTALIVDDNKLNLLVADKILSKENFKCTTIDNGFDAIELVKNNDYDIILMDINMPKLNGIGTTKRIREFNITTPIIALTAVDVTQLNKQIMQAGLNDYILKPYDKNHLLEMIYKHLANNPIYN